ncbi:MAG TPA: tetratricopeptide repeat protein [Dongiaceae bacterium]|nr:tetratricopeptide repeat protein [Dongiaceae bacterium]
MALACLALVLLTAAAYSGLWKNGFVNYDDRQYITENRHIAKGLTWSSARWAATASYESNWHPLTWMSHALDISLFGLQPAGHHAVNLLLHIGNALLLFLLLREATCRFWPSWIVSALFAVHPVNVESVAWAAERKNVLSLFFLLLALWQYQRYARSPSPGRYLAVAALFAAGLAAKPQVITLPFLLLLWDFWPLQRNKSDVNQGGASWLRLCAEKVPLLLLSAASALITVRSQAQGGAIQKASVAGRTVAAYGLETRVGNALVAYCRYLELFFFPHGLAPMYPHPGATIPGSRVALSALLLVAITAAVVWLRRWRFLPVGWLFFLGALVPMIGLVQVGAQAMADRYAYLPYIGVFCAVVWSGATVASGVSLQRVALFGGVAAAVVLALLTYQQVAFWRNPEALWMHTLAVTQRNFIAHDSLGGYWLEQGRMKEGCAEFRASQQLFAEDVPALEGLAVCAQASGNLDEAARRYQEVARMAGDGQLRSMALANLGSVYRSQKDYVHASESFAAALQVNPDLPIALVGAGLAATKSWDYPRAIALFEHAMQVQPTSVGYLLLARARELNGQHEQSLSDQQQAARLSHDLAQDQRIADALWAE